MSPEYKRSQSYKKSDIARPDPEYFPLTYPALAGEGMIPHRARRGRVHRASQFLP
jgi:hypothetical protein